MSIPVYVYGPVVLVMLSTHMFTVWYAMRQIRTLQAALVAKRVLLREPTHLVGKRQQLAPGDMLMVEDKSGNTLVQIDAHSSADISIRSFA